MKIEIMGLVLVFLATGCCGSGVSGYDPRADAQLLRKTRDVNSGRPGRPLMASAPEAAAAAQRIFSSFRFEGATRLEVLKLLGDPRTISDYAKREEVSDHERLVYLFDTGFGGMRYILRFESGRVRALETESLE